MNGVKGTLSVGDFWGESGECGGGAFSRRIRQLALLNQRHILRLLSVSSHAAPTHTPPPPSSQCCQSRERLKRYRTSPACSELTHFKTSLPQSSPTVLIPAGSRPKPSTAERSMWRLHAPLAVGMGIMGEGKQWRGATLYKNIYVKCRCTVYISIL